MRYQQRQFKNRRLLELVRGAKESVPFIAYSFTDDDLPRTLLDRARDGVLVRGVFDES